MGLRQDVLAGGEYYHIYNRGNSKQEIFLDDKDRDRFVKLLYLCNSTQKIKFKEQIVDRKIDAWDFDKKDSIVSIGAWVLMPNHFHILIISDENSDESNNSISIFMKKLCTAYSMYFNKCHKRTGKLFEGVFKAKNLNSDRYLKYIFSYIHLNPLKLIDPLWRERGVKNMSETNNFLKKYRWSSYSDYLDENRKEIKILNKDVFPKYFENKEIFENEIYDWLRHPKEFP